MPWAARSTSSATRRRPDASSPHAAGRPVPTRRSVRTRGRRRRAAQGEPRGSLRCRCAGARQGARVRRHEGTQDGLRGRRARRELDAREDERVRSASGRRGRHLPRAVHFRRDQHRGPDRSLRGGQEARLREGLLRLELQREREGERRGGLRRLWHRAPRPRVGRLRRSRREGQDRRRHPRRTRVARRRVPAGALHRLQVRDRRRQGRCRLPARPEQGRVDRHDPESLPPGHASRPVGVGRHCGHAPCVQEHDACEAEGDARRRRAGQGLRHRRAGRDGGQREVPCARQGAQCARRHQGARS